MLAAVAAIEVYNKPNFSYREEAFSLLMTNAWELLLKAKWVADHGDTEKSLHSIKLLRLKACFNLMLINVAVILAKARIQLGWMLA